MRFRTPNVAHAVAALVGLLLLSWVPVASAQGLQEPVEGCVENCLPQDLNGSEPKRGDQVTYTILYAHHESLVQRAPLTVQYPPDAAPNHNGGYLLPTIETEFGLDDVAGKTVEPNFVYNWFTLASTSGPAEWTPEGKLDWHQEGGLMLPLHIAEEPMTLYVYLSAHPVPTSSSSGSLGALANVDAVPQVGVYARLETGRMREASESILIAEGDTGACDVNDLPTCEGRVSLVSLPGEPDIYEFAVPMNVVQNHLPDIREPGGEAGFTLSFKPYQVWIRDDVPGEGSQFMQNNYRLRAGPQTPVRVAIPHTHPLGTYSYELVSFNSELFTRWSMGSVWGSYDVDVTRATISVEGPTSIDPDTIRPPIARQITGHDGHFVPINFTWRIPIDAGRLSDGDYSIRVSVPNLQGSYVLEETFPFAVRGGQFEGVRVIGGGSPGPGDGQGKSANDAPGTPGPAFALALAVVVGASYLRRRHS